MHEVGVGTFSEVTVSASHPEVYLTLKKYVPLMWGSEDKQGWKSVSGCRKSAAACRWGVHLNVCICSAGNGWSEDFNLLTAAVSFSEFSHRDRKKSIFASKKSDNKRSFWHFMKHFFGYRSLFFFTFFADFHVPMALTADQMWGSVVVYEWNGDTEI